MVQVPLLIQESSDSGVGPYLPNLDADCDDDVHHHHLASGRRQESNLVALTLYDILSNRGHVHPVGHGSLQQDNVCVSYGVGYCRHLRGPTGDMGLAARIGFLLHSGVHDQHLPGVGNGLDQRVAGQPPQFTSFIWGMHGLFDRIGIGLGQIVFNAFDLNDPVSITCTSVGFPLAVLLIATVFINVDLPHYEFQMVDYISEEFDELLDVDKNTNLFSRSK
eukprot:CAMPEP_0116894148 /NCGR_PEP_ID=MMETSP0467-20121206/3992_1 /TAXON_ID=283647 /ORGANISM="Mesodinium pulex, Strain SPMC105" /LENGTH=219 /DNA_ID=CAMNT_0004564229 /DNA_START=867 /DNA_END=1527 /DNA_ORIENTATION=-